MEALRKDVNTIAAYAPTERNTVEAITFYNALQTQLGKYNSNWKVVIFSNLNARVGRNPIPKVVGSFGWELRIIIFDYFESLTNLVN